MAKKEKTSVTLKEKQPITTDYFLRGFIVAKNCNPNGDPELDNLPRTDPYSGLGIMTGICFKRHIRDYILDEYPNVEGYDIMIKSGCVKQSVGADAKKIAKDNNICPREFMLQKYFDARTFGDVMSTYGLKNVTGPVQVAHIESVNVIEVESNTTSTVAVTKDSQVSDDKTGTMGKFRYTPFGLYSFTIQISKSRAEDTGFSEKDLEILKEAICYMYNKSTSASKIGMQVLNLWEIKLLSGKCCYNANTITKAISAKCISNNPHPRSEDEYEFVVDPALTSDSRCQVTKVL